MPNSARLTTSKKWSIGLSTKAVCAVGEQLLALGAVLMCLVWSAKRMTTVTITLFNSMVCNKRRHLCRCCDMTNVLRAASANGWSIWRMPHVYIIQIICRATVKMRLHGLAFMTRTKLWVMKPFGKSGKVCRPSQQAMLCGVVGLRQI